MDKMVEKYNGIYGIIPARAGSKRIKGKNLQLLQGVPLIDHTINFANDLPINRCIISSDSDKIRDRANGKVTARLSGQAILAMIILQMLNG